MNLVLGQRRPFVWGVLVECTCAVDFQLNLFSSCYREMTNSVRIAARIKAKTVLKAVRCQAVVVVVFVRVLGANLCPTGIPKVSIRQIQTYVEEQT